MKPYVVSPSRSQYVPGERFKALNAEKGPAPRKVRYAIEVVTEEGVGLVFGPVDQEIDCLDFTPPYSQGVIHFIVRYNADGTESRIWQWRKGYWRRCSDVS